MSSAAAVRAGQGRAEVASVQGQSEVVDLYATSPLRLLTPRPRGAASWLVQSSLGGGLVDGDAITMSLTVRPGARAALLTQASTKVYRSPRGTSQRIEATADAGSLLVSWPEPVACFAGSRFEQSTRARLDAAASFVLVDAFTAGRMAYGERWAADHITSRMLVEVAGKTLVDETLRLDPAEGPVGARLGRFDAFATVLLGGPLLAQTRSELLAQVAAAPLAPQASLVESVSPLGDHALCWRGAARGVAALIERLRLRLASVGPGLLGGDLHRGKA